MLCGRRIAGHPFVDRRPGRRAARYLLVSTTGVGLGFMLLYFAHGALATAASLTVIGVFESVLHPTAATAIADVVPSDKLRGQFALTRVMSNAGSMVGPAIGAVLALVVAWVGVLRIGRRNTRGRGGRRGVPARDPAASCRSRTRTTRKVLSTSDGRRFRDRRLGRPAAFDRSVLENSGGWIGAVTRFMPTTPDSLTPPGIGLPVHPRRRARRPVPASVTQASSQPEPASPPILWTGSTGRWPSPAFLHVAARSLIAAITLLWRCRKCCRARSPR